MNEVSRIGLDLAKRVFHVHGVDASGGAVVKRQLRRGEMEGYFKALAPCLVGMEACGTAHHWARLLRGLGHEVRLLPPAYVKPYVKRGKSDAIDAEAICEALARPSMRFVPVKSAEQQGALMLHRARTQLVSQRTRLTNALRAHLAELGIVARLGAKGQAELLAILRDPAETRLPALARAALQALAGQIEALALAIDKLEVEIMAEHKRDETSRRLATIPGVGPIVATALVATAGDATRFASGRHFAAWLGLVPRQNATGGKDRRQPISKAGDGAMRRLLVLGATAVIRRSAKPGDARAAWIRKLLAKKPPRLVTVALANKMARIAWVLMTRGGTYRADLAGSGPTRAAA